MGHLTVEFEKNCQILNIPLNIYLRIMNKAIEQTRNDLQDLDTALAQTDYEKMRYVSHRLKGDYDNLRITEIALVAKDINDIAKMGEGKGKIEELVAFLKTNFSELEQIISEKTK